MTIVVDISFICMQFALNNVNLEVEISSASD